MSEKIEAGMRLIEVTYSMMGKHGVVSKVLPFGSTLGHLRDAIGANTSMEARVAGKARPDGLILRHDDHILFVPRIRGG